MANLSNINNKFLVTTGGNVGINSTGPGEKLEVNGNIQGLDTLILKNSSSGVKWQFFRDGNETLNFRYNNGTSWSSSAISIKNNNNVGIGHTTLYQKFTVNGNIDIRGGDGCFLTFNNGDANISIHNNNADSVVGRDLSFKTYKAGVGNTEKMRITRDGNVGIGTTSPTARLDILTNSATGDNDIDRTVRFRADNGEQRFLFNVGRSGNGATLSVYNEAEIEKVKISTGSDSYFNGGDVGIGTTSPVSLLTIGDATTNNPHAAADDVQIRTAIDGGMTISCGSDSGTGSIFFGDTSDNARGQIRYNHNTDDLTLTAADNIILSENVGIGTTLPRGKGLEIFRAAGLSSNPQLIISTGESGSQDYSLSTDVTAAGDFCIVKGPSNVAANVIMKIVSSGITTFNGFADGDKIKWTKDNVLVGSIGTYNGVPYIGYQGGAGGGIMFNGASIEPTLLGSTRSSNTNDIGSVTYRWRNLWLSGDIVSHGNADFGGNVVVNNMLTINIDDISTGENRGLKLYNENSSGQQWNITAGRVGQENKSFVIRDASNNVDAIIINEQTAGTNGLITVADGGDTTLNAEFHIYKNAGDNTISELLRLDCGENNHNVGKGGAIVFRDINVYTDTAKIIAQRNGNTSSSTLQFLLRNSEVMRLTSGGDVLIGKTGTALATAGIEAAGNNTLRATKNNSAPVEFNRLGSDGDIVLFYKDTANKGSVSITSSAVSYNTSSDYRLKEDLQDFAGLDMVSKIPVYNFKWKTDENRSYGVMAHELQEVLPDAVTGEKNAEEMQGVDYSKIVPILVKSIQELKAEIDELKK